MRLCIFTQVISHRHQRFIDLKGAIKKALEIRKPGLFKFFGHVCRSKVNSTRNEKESLVIKLA
jgi:hypothetical protein